MLAKLGKVADVALVVLAFVVGGLALGNYIERSRGEGRSPIDEVAEIEGEVLPSFEIQYLGGRIDTLPATDTPTLLYFFSTQCSACRRNEEAWRALADSLRGVATVVALSAESLDAVAAHYSDSARSYSVGVIATQDQSTLLKAYRMWVTPIAYLIDSQGKLRASVVGIFDAKGTDLLISTARSLRSERTD